MNVRGERVIVFGDSLSKHGHDAAPEIWDVNEGSQRASGQPGDLLASLLAEQGAEAVRVNARVGRSAYNFWGREPAQKLIDSDNAFKPTKVVIVLGTNDIGLSMDKDADAMRAIQNVYKAMGAEVWAIGPVSYVSPALNAQAEPVVAMMSSVFGSRFVDGRPLSVNVGRAGDGVHFTAQSARGTALAMADALISKQAVPTWLPFAIGGGVIVGLGLMFAFFKGNRRAYAFAGPSGLAHLQGPDFTDDETTVLQMRLEELLTLKGEDALDEERDEINAILEKIGGYFGAARKPRKRKKAEKMKALPSAEDHERPTKPIKPLNDHELLAAVQEAVRTADESARFGKRKVFVSDVLERVGPTSGMTNDQFKRWLLSQQAAGAIQMVRADLVSAMDPKIVAASEIKHDRAAFHFIVDPNAKERWEMQGASIGKPIVPTPSVQDVSAKLLDKFQRQANTTKQGKEIRAAGQGANLDELVYAAAGNAAYGVHQMFDDGDDSLGETPKKSKRSRMPTPETVRMKTLSDDEIAAEYQAKWKAQGILKGPKTTMKIGAIVSSAADPTALYRVTTKLVGGGYELQPHQRSGKPVVIMQSRVGRRNVWNDGSAEWVVRDEG